MQPVAATTSVNVPVPQQPVAAAGSPQSVIAELLRAGGAGMATASRQTALAGDKAAIHPFESVITLTSLLQAKTAKIPGVSGVTSTLNTIAGYALLLLASNATGAIKATGASYEDFAQRLADAIDGQETAGSWASNWGTTTQSDVGAVLSALGVR